MQKSLNILHISALPQLSKMLAEIECAGPGVRSAHYTRGGGVPPTDGVDILHLHGVSLLAEKEILELIRARQTEKKAVVISLFKDGLICESLNLEALCRDNLELLQRCSALFLQDCSVFAYVAELENWSWSGIPMACQTEAIDETVFDQKDQFKILYYPEAGKEDELKRLRETVSSAISEGINYELKLAEASHACDLNDLISECDIFIETSGVSYHALTALSLGKTILAGIPDEAVRITKQFELSPVLKTDSVNLFYRLKSLAKQPKSLRDFGRRGLQYIRDFHNPRDINQIYLEIYNQVL